MLKADSDESIKLVRNLIPLFKGWWEYKEVGEVS